LSDPRKRLAQLADAWSLPEGRIAQLGTLLELLAADPAAPTSDTDPARAVDRHLADSLSALGIEGMAAAETVVDIGSGAGFPGLVLAIAMPDASFDLVESVVRKAAFIERAIESCGLHNVRVIPRRVEEWGAAEGSQSYEVVTARAVAPLATLVEYAAPLLATGGMLVAWKGRRDAGDEERADAAAETLGMTLSELRPVRPFAGSRDRHLHVYGKVGPTPAGYPRRVGMARKRPLGGR
jgi:16S rRNA (guanine527-N7)-methyltransferase